MMKEILLYSIIICIFQLSATKNNLKSSPEFLQSNMPMINVIIVAKQHSFPVEVGQQECVLQIKKKIEQHLGISVALQTLSVNDWVLIDGFPIEDYPIITGGTRIDLTVGPFEPPPILQRCDKINVIVKVLPDRQFNVEINQTDTVGDLKEKIHKVVTYSSVKRMSLFFLGKRLENNLLKLSECGIHNFSEIYMCPKPAMTRTRDWQGTKKIQFLVKIAFSTIIPCKINDSITIGEMTRLFVSQQILPPHDHLFVHEQEIMRANYSLKSQGVRNGQTIYVYPGAVSYSRY